MRIVGILLHVVKKGGADGCGAEANLLACDLRNSERMHYIGLSRASAHSFVRKLCHVERLCDDFYIASVVRGHVGVNELLESGIDHLFIALCLQAEIFL